MKDGVSSFGDYIKTVDSKKKPLPPLRILTLPELDDFEGEAEVAAAYRPLTANKKTEHDIPWLAFLNAGIETSQRFRFDWQNSFPSAVAAVRIRREGKDTFYALTFGLGAEAFIDNDLVVRDFGIKVAMNIADPEKLKRVRTSIHEAISTQAERQISVGSRFTVFNVDDEKEFLRTLSGRALSEYSFVASFTGKESISLQIDKDEPLSWNNLIYRIDKVGAAYSSTAYRDTFRSYDKFRIVPDGSLIEVLDDLAFEKIKSKDYDQAHLAPPEFIDFDHAAFMYLSDEDEVMYNDLALDDLLAQRKQNFGKRSSMASIRSMKIALIDTSTDIRVRTWSAYKCLVAEVQHSDHTYILSMGTWKQVSDDLKEEVESYIGGITVESRHYLPDGISIWKSDAKKDKNGNSLGENREEVFNAAVSADCGDLVLFDKAKIEIAGQRLYEVCDLLHLDKSMVQVKRFRSGSASVSHLFVQGRFYADAFVGDDSCRATMAEHIQKELGSPDGDPFVAILPADRSKLIANDYCVVFCILVDTTGFSLSNLPFMARYELMHSHRHIHRVLGFQCRVVFPVVVTGP